MCPFTDCIVELSYKEIDHTKVIDVVIQMYNLIEYSANYSKTSRSLWRCYRVEPFINNGTVMVFLIILIVLHLNINQK